MLLYGVLDGHTRQLVGLLHGNLPSSSGACRRVCHPAQGSAPIGEARDHSGNFAGMLPAQSGIDGGHYLTAFSEQARVLQIAFGGMDRDDRSTG